MRHGIWTFVLLLLTAVVCASAIPKADLPETSYNEVDTPVNQSPPLVLGIRFARPARVAITIPRKEVQARSETRAPVEERTLATVAVRHHSHSLQELLCTLLI